MEVSWEVDEAPEVWPSEECSPPAHQEATAHSWDSSVNPIVVLNDFQRDGLEVKKTFLDTVSDPGPETPRGCASNYGDYEVQSPSPFPFTPSHKDGKLTFPDFQRQTRMESFKANWEDLLNLHNGSQNLACPEPGSNHPVAHCKKWSETADKKWCQAYQHATSLAKGACCYCMHKSIDAVRERYKGAEGLILHQFGLEATLQMDWSNLASLPDLISGEIFLLLPGRCPHWQLSCPKGTCPPGTSQCHHHLHRLCQKANCPLCHCGKPTKCPPRRYEWQSKRNQGRASKHQNAHELWTTWVSTTWCPTPWSSGSPTPWSNGSF